MLGKNPTLKGVELLHYKMEEAREDESTASAAGKSADADRRIISGTKGESYDVTVTEPLALLLKLKFKLCFIIMQLLIFLFMSARIGSFTFTTSRRTLTLARYCAYICVMPRPLMSRCHDNRCWYGNYWRSLRDCVNTDYIY